MLRSIRLHGWLLAWGCRVQDLGFWGLGFGFRIWGSIRLSEMHSTMLLHVAFMTAQTLQASGVSGPQGPLKVPQVLLSAGGQCILDSGS